eukprot:TRINITY_DN12575_c0_g1_i21.p1 TRINITY_DN12575_c0_g1~~TRINITY_DN12575_c0_g1_i21.p1  ORF type:complete len:183 (+),score=32.42 TRINITY_DN12575_c0_g1_i21:586-1134(+)
MDLLSRVVPELKSVGRADNDLELGSYPKLKHVIQNSHASISGTVKFKHFTVYARPSMNTNPLPAIDPANACSEFHLKGASHSYTHKEVLEAAKQIDKLDFSQHEFCLFSVPFSSPLTLTLSTSVCKRIVIHAVSNKKYVTFPQSYNVKNIIYLLNTQRTQTLFTEPEMLQAIVPDVNCEYQY